MELTRRASCTTTAASGKRLAPGDLCAIDIRFAPGSDGTSVIQEATLSVEGSLGALAITLTGNDVVPNVFTADQLTPVDFGVVGVGSSSSVASLTVTNNGSQETGPLITGSYPQDDFAITNDTCANSTLAVGSSCTVAFAARPSLGGRRVGSIFVADDSQNGNGGGAVARSLAVSGAVTVTVTKTGAGTGLVSSQPAGIDCGSTCVAEMAAELALLRASGDGFSGWSGNFCGGTGICRLTLTDDRDVTATFD